MPIGNIKDLNLKQIKHPDALDASIAVMVSPLEGWDGYVMRVIEVAPQGYTPKHAHSWPHINYIIEGNGILMIDGLDTLVSAGSYAYVPGDKLHQFKNNGDATFKFICIVPEVGHTY